MLSISLWKYRTAPRALDKNTLQSEIEGRMKTRVSIAVLLIVTACALSCSFKKSKSTGESAVARFHTQFNAEQYHEMYGQTHEGFRKATTEQQMIEYLKAVHRKLGEVKDAEQTRWFVNATTAGTKVSLAYKTSFAEGEAAEQFVFLVEGDNSALYSYNVSSPILVTK